MVLGLEICAKIKKRAYDAIQSKWKILSLKIKGMFDCVIIAVAGGSCSGKTTIVHHLQSYFGNENSAAIMQDNYYLNHGGIMPPNIANFDDPNAIDFNLLEDHLLQLKAGQPIETPDYDFVTHMRKQKTYRINPVSIIFVDGILILSNARIRNICDFSIFVDCGEDIRRNRRINRDTRSRGRRRENIIEQFEAQVLPMHEKYVEPSKAHADLVMSQKDCDDILSKKITDCLTPLFTLTDVIISKQLNKNIVRS